MGPGPSKDRRHCTNSRSVAPHGCGPSGPLVIRLAKTAIPHFLFGFQNRNLNLNTSSELSGPNDEYEHHHHGRRQVRLQLGSKDSLTSVGRSWKFVKRRIEILSRMGRRTIIMIRSSLFVRRKGLFLFDIIYNRFNYT